MSFLAASRSPSRVTRETALRPSCQTTAGRTRSLMSDCVRPANEITVHEVSELRKTTHDYVIRKLDSIILVIDYFNHVNRNYLPRLSYGIAKRER